MLPFSSGAILAVFVFSLLKGSKTLRVITAAPAVITLADSWSAISDGGIRAVLETWAVFLLASLVALAPLDGDDQAAGVALVVLTAVAGLLYQPVE